MTRANYNAAIHALARALIDDGTNDIGDAVRELEEAQRQIEAWRQRLLQQIQATQILQPGER